MLQLFGRTTAAAQHGARLYSTAVQTEVLAIGVFAKPKPAKPAEASATAKTSTSPETEPASFVASASFELHDQESGGAISRAVRAVQTSLPEFGQIKTGCVTLHGVHPRYRHVVVGGLGEAPTTLLAPQDSASESTVDPQDATTAAEAKQLKTARSVAAQVTTAARAVKASNVVFDMPLHGQGLSEGAALSSHALRAFKPSDKNQTPSFSIIESANAAGAAGGATTVGSGETSRAFERGLLTASCQNFARTLAETPSNHMTPSIFVDTVRKEFQPFIDKDVVRFTAHDKAWAEQQKMGAYLAVAQGTSEPLRFLEIEYRGSGNRDAAPLVLVGKGITFDSGGISIKPSAGMGEMRGDMGGAAVVVSALLGAVRLGLPIDVVVVTPLCENMPSGTAIKPGDVVTSMSGQTIEVDNTDAEGRLILADALTYAQRAYKPHTIIDVATLTGAIAVALGNAAAGLFSNNATLSKKLRAAGNLATDPFHPMPIFQEHRDSITSTFADIKNTGKNGGGSCTAAAFLEKFVESKSWAHIDIAGVMHYAAPTGFMSAGMTGRATRPLIEFMAQLSREAIPKPESKA
ncbi:leucine aminopeptidase [Capsaspora owczarzaki ATCC 30864]|uniref:leucyl aminopeptidase n=1 Tax=Capsaspora owczarzaki (strain ATCC 30864) TaxID=595528 RepID=A0A0D2WMP3_CAPO3|nr:leucine aminopeptidase [Capsaspora owczarzaki ATCC 30864]KJE92155.1 leucine aminopeptidase [Capsaspora owczarzaki ATCC 30864]|eukprot:XP_004364013.1 leucine aminopeptidase [Capsaspora owczarzaki ATCC 30864]